MLKRDANPVICSLSFVCRVVPHALARACLTRRPDVWGCWLLVNAYCWRGGVDGDHHAIAFGDFVCVGAMNDTRSLCYQMCGHLYNKLVGNRNTTNVCSINMHICTYVSTKFIGRTLVFTPTRTRVQAARTMHATVSLHTRTNAFYIQTECAHTQTVITLRI